ncbi:MAG: PEP-CTERM sorting domain-containing protein [Terrimicrobiaceae bacterium]|nr:PEP-CTERM sorting domain-containing protein [Terrimicrobiaceae bacterium]
MKKTLTIIGLALASAVGAQAQILVDNFNTYSNGNLVGQGGWVQTGTTATNPIQVSGGVVTLVQGSNQDANRPFGSAVTTGSIYYFATINVSAKNATGDYFLHLGDGGTSAFGARLYARSAGAGYQLAWGGSSTAPTTFGAELSFSTNYNIVFRYNIIAGAANDTGSLYVSTGTFDSVETNNTPYQNVTTWTGGTEVSSFAAIYLRQGTNTGTETIDQVRVATTWAQAIPEPSTWALIGLGTTVVLMGIRRRRSIKA